MSIMGLTLLLIIGCIVVAIILGFSKGGNKLKEQEEKKQLERDYFKSLEGFDTKEILRLGREYYSSLGISKATAESAIRTSIAKTFPQIIPVDENILETQRGEPGSISDSLVSLIDLCRQATRVSPEQLSKLEPEMYRIQCNLQEFDASLGESGSRNYLLKIMWELDKKESLV